MPRWRTLRSTIASRKWSVSSINVERKPAQKSFGFPGRILNWYEALKHVVAPSDVHKVVLLLWLFVISDDPIGLSLKF